MVEPKIGVSHLVYGVHRALGQNARMIRQPQQVSLLGKLATIVIGSALVVLGLMFSVVLIALLAVLGVGFWGYLRWKTRGLRRAMREQAASAPVGGTVIDGEAVVVAEHEPGDRPVPLVSDNRF